MNIEDLSLGSHQSVNKYAVDEKVKEWKSLKEACAGFENMFFKEIFQDMLKATPLAEDQEGEEEFAWDRLTDHISEIVTERGGFGFAEHLMKGVASQWNIKDQDAISGEVAKK